MVEQQEIILMTKLALHEKKYGKEDKKRNAYFKWDYIYINNWHTRFAAGMAAVIIISWMIFTDVYIKEIIPIVDIELGDYLAKYIFFFIVLILVYTGFSTMIFNQRYEETQRRLQQYKSILKELDVYQASKQDREGGLYDSVESVIPGS